MATTWVREDRERLLRTLEDLWPGSTQRGGVPRTAAIQEWLDALQRYPAKLVDQALRDAKREAQTDREPTIGSIVKRTADQVRALARWRREKAESQEPLLTAQEFACCEELWAPRENDPDPRLAEWYRLTRERLYSGLPLTPWPASEPRKREGGTNGRWAPPSERLSQPRASDGVSSGGPRPCE